MSERTTATVDSRGKPRVQTINTEPSKTVQADAKKGDINEILKKYNQGKDISAHLRDVDATYRDVSEFTDYADMMRQIRTAETEFMGLPSKVRELFDHDVARWLDAAHATPEENSELLAKAGVDDSPPADTDGGPTPEPTETP